MNKIEIINGVYGARDSNTNRVTPVPIGGTVDVTDEEAARLVRLKVAKVIGEEIPADGVATIPAHTSSDGAGVNAPDGNGGAEVLENGFEEDEVLDIVDGHFTVESLMKMERKEMEALAADLEIEADAIKKCKNKTELANLIAKVEVAVEDDGDDEPPVDTGEEPPALDVESPVV